MTASVVTAFLKRMKDIDQSKRRTEVFRDFCELAFCALAKTTAHPPEKAERLEAQYMACVGRYRNPDDVRIMPDLLAMTVKAVASGGRDFLGEIGALDAGLGQFFTPNVMSRLMAEMTLSGAAEIIQEHGFLAVGEPADDEGPGMPDPSSLVACFVQRVGQLRISFLHIVVAAVRGHPWQAEIDRGDIVVHARSIGQRKFDRK
jgi:hypothetical protein